MLSMHVYFRNQASRVSVKWRDKERPLIFQLDSSSACVYSWKTIYLLAAFQNSLIHIFRMLIPSKRIHIWEADTSKLSADVLS